MVSRFSMFLERRPGLALLIGLSTAVLLISGFSRLHANYTHKVWFSPGDPELVRYERFENQFGNDSGIVIVAHRPDGIFQPEAIQILRGLTQKLWETEEIYRVESITNYQLVSNSGEGVIVEPLFPDPSDDRQEITADLVEKRRQIIRDKKAVHGYLMGEDLKTAMLYGFMKPAFDGQPKYGQLYQDVKKLINSVPKEAGFTFHLSGIAAFQGSLEEDISSDLLHILPLVVLLYALIVFFLVRSFLPIVICLAVPGVAIASALGLAGWLDIPWDPLTPALPEILIAICISDIVHIFSIFYQNVYKSVPPKQALAHSARANFFPTLMTTMTNSVGFISFVTSPLIPIAHLGILVGIGTSIAWFFTYFIVVPLLYIAMDRGFSPKIPTNINEGGFNGGTLIRFVLRWRVGIIAFTAILIFGSSFFASKVGVNGDILMHYHPDHPMKKSFEFIQKHVGGDDSIELVIDSGETDGIKDPAFLKKVKEFNQWMLSLEHSSKVISLIDVIEDVHSHITGDRSGSLPEQKNQVAEALLIYGLSLPPGIDINNWKSHDDRKLRMTLRLKTPDVATNRAYISMIEKEAEKRGLPIDVTGISALTSNVAGMLIQTMFQSLLGTLIPIYLLMAFTFRSLRMALIAMIPNVVPSIFAAASMWFLGFSLDVGTVIALSIAIGIAVDDTIHLFTHYLAHLKEGDSKIDAFEKAFEHCGYSVVVTTVLLTVGFFSFFFGELRSLYEFGITSGLALLFAVLLDLFLLPAIVLSYKGRMTKNG